ncbi:MAG: hypothetical protein WA138_05050 [Parvibaculum sp.]
MFFHQSMPVISRFIRPLVLGALLAMLGTQAAEARNTKLTLPVDGVLSSSDAKQKLDGGVAFYFGKSHHPAVIKKFGNYATNKKTNSFGKPDEEACNRAMLSALITLQERAQKEGGNAVINIESYYKKEPNSLNSEFECHAGGFVAGVALRGDVVKLAK